MIPDPHPVPNPAQGRPRKRPGAAAFEPMPWSAREPLLRAIARMPEPAILLSGAGPAGGGRGPRWTVACARPRRWIEIRGDDWRSGGVDVVESEGRGDALDALRAFLRTHRLDRLEPAPGFDGGGAADFETPFRGGAIGYFGYEFGGRFERAPRRWGPSNNFPDARLAIYDDAWILDHDRGTIVRASFDVLGEGPAAVRERARRRDATLSAALADRDAGGDGPRVPRIVPVADQSREAFEERIARAIEYIKAGDIFQVNLAQRFRAEMPAGTSPADLWDVLRKVAPAPYSAFLAWGDRAILSVSPECLFTIRDRRAFTRPIKGTRPRGATPAEDEALAAELLASPKDRAELTMIVDLERNDLGRVCRPGTMRVTEPVVLERHSNVHHLVATVEGELGPGVGAVDLLRAVFPGGSITGAPKIRAMEIVDELEPCPRGPYTGSIGYFSACGNAAFNIAIRTLSIADDALSYHVGGGIVADSIPEREYRETLDKASGIVRALGGGGAAR